MRIYITNLKKDKISVEVDLEERFNPFSFMGEEIEFTKPVKVKGHLDNLNEAYYLKGKIEYELQLQCYRCLKSYFFKDTLDFQQELCQDEDSEFNNGAIITSEYIDITPVILNNIILSIPMKKLCNESCKGICGKCGTNKNLEDCSCSNDNINPKMEILKKLLLE